eukprot:Gregarina_sp_Pseudo_9__411@NODE_126_length_4116_cov_86_100074_g118_i0_p3_GENE_NODE_126_length_4116_cov_86_100074_g118_i0NODE_126_length_4116_cov_86_100074_g118_i0_p3_ORF_typecomplete_len102_score9_39Viral_cys_rich/PF08008_12/0_068_NODE_126_length_4116_cov_86_100074_g118_i034693774
MRIHFPRSRPTPATQTRSASHPRATCRESRPPCCMQLATTTTRVGKHKSPLTALLAHVKEYTLSCPASSPLSSPRLSVEALLDCDSRQLLELLCAIGLRKS